MQKNFFEILVQTALTVGLFWTILKLTPKSALLSFTILYYSTKNWLSIVFKRLRRHLFLGLFPSHILTILSGALRSAIFPLFITIDNKIG